MVDEERLHQDLEEQRTTGMVSGVAPEESSGSDSPFRSAPMKSVPSPRWRTSYHRAARIASRSAASRTSTRTARRADQRTPHGGERRGGRPARGPARIELSEPGLHFREPSVFDPPFELIRSQRRTESPNELLPLRRWQSHGFCQQGLHASRHFRALRDRPHASARPSWRTAIGLTRTGYSASTTKSTGAGRGVASGEPAEITPPGGSRRRVGRGDGPRGRVGLREPLPCPPRPAAPLVGEPGGAQEKD